MQHMHQPVMQRKKRKDCAFWRHFNEKPSIISGCPGVMQSLLMQVGKPKLGDSFSARTNCPLVRMWHIALRVRLHLLAAKGLPNSGI